MPNGPRLLALISAALAVMFVALAVLVSPGAEAAGAVTRWTARTSVVLFSLAYVARPLVQLHPTRTTKALLARRKWIGLGFAVSHGFHLIGILWVASPDPGAFVRSRDPSILVAVATFLLIGAMAVTSIESIKRKIPGRAWKRLHWTGMQLAWISFISTYAAAITASIAYAAPTLLLLAIAAVRTASWRRARRIATAHARYGARSA